MYMCFLDIILLHTYRLQYGVNITLYALGSQNNCVTSFIVILALLRWSRTKPTISPGYTCNGTKLEAVM